MRALNKKYFIFLFQKSISVWAIFSSNVCNVSHFLSLFFDFLPLFFTISINFQIPLCCYLTLPPANTLTHRGGQIKTNRKIKLNQMNFGFSIFRFRIQAILGFRFRFSVSVYPNQFQCQTENQKITRYPNKEAQNTSPTFLLPL